MPKVIVTLLIGFFSFTFKFKNDKSSYTQTLPATLQNTDANKSY